MMTDKVQVWSNQPTENRYEAEGQEAKFPETRKKKTHSKQNRKRDRSEDKLSD